MPTFIKDFLQTQKFILTHKIYEVNQKIFPNNKFRFKKL